MATFNGDPIFGFLKTMTTVINPRAFQSNAYPAQNGTEELDNGLRGKFTTCAGLLFGDGPAGLAQAEAIFNSYYDGVPYVLVDNLGTSWDFVKLESFTPTGRVTRDAYNVYRRHYEARFRHLL